MKKLILYTLLLMGFISNAQNRKLVKLAKGQRNLGTYILYDENKNDVFGYLDLIRLDEIDRYTLKVKYTIMDKNFNELATGNFKSTRLKGNFKLRVRGVIYNQGKVFFALSPYFYSSKQGYIDNYIEYLVIDIKENKIIKKDYLKQDNLSSKTIRRSVKGKKYNYLLGKYRSVELYNIKNKGIFVIRESPTDGLYLLNYDGNVVWDLDKSIKKNRRFTRFSVFDANEKYIIIALRKYNFFDLVLETLYLVDTDTGKVVGKITNIDEVKNNVLFSKITDDNKMIVLGKYVDKKNKKKYLGLYKVVFDLNNKAKIISKKHISFSKLGIKGINRTGKIPRRGYLGFESFNINPDGKIIAISEIYRGGNYKGLYFMLFDKDFNSVKSTFFEGNKSKERKFAFSEYLKKDKGKFFILFDKNSKNQYDLHFLIYNFSDNSIREKFLKVDTKKRNVSISMAKKGYILINEYFKKAKKGEVSRELRLEKVE